MSNSGRCSIPESRNAPAGIAEDKANARGHSGEDDVTLEALGSAKQLPQQVLLCDLRLKCQLSHVVLGTGSGRLPVSHRP